MKVPFAVALLILSVVMPVELSFYIGGVLMTPTRAVLILMILPAIYRLLQKGQLQRYDLSLLAFTSWIVLSFAFNHGVAVAIESGGVLALEVLAGYLIARTYIVHRYQYLATIRLLMVLAIIMLPFVVFEALTGSHYIHEFAATIGGFSYPLDYEQRLGMTRAYGPFSHPILMGVFSSSLIGIIWYGCLNCRLSGKLLKVGLISATTFFSLSSAPILLAIFQFLAIAWNRVAAGFQHRWRLVVLAFSSLYIFLSFWSPYPPLIVILSKITLNPGTAYYRMLIWEYGSAEVARHPLFGIGLNDWVRPVWMIYDSIDNFWLKQGMRFGIPALLFLSISVILVVRKAILLSRENISFQSRQILRGWIVSMITLILIGFTVDFFGTIHVYLYFLLGLGAALIPMVEAEVQQ